MLITKCDIDYEFDSQWDASHSVNSCRERLLRWAWIKKKTMDGGYYRSVHIFGVWLLYW